MSARSYFYNGLNNNDIICICRGKQALGYSDSELANMGGYDLVHYDDLAYVASAHQESESSLMLP